MTHKKKPSILTGRRPPEDPVLHYLPPSSEFGKQLRKVFEAKEGHSFIAPDYSALEIRLYQHFLQEPPKPCELYPRRSVRLLPLRNGYVRVLGPVIKSKEEGHK